MKLSLFLGGGGGCNDFDELPDIVSSNSVRNQTYD